MYGGSRKKRKNSSSLEILLDKQEETRFVNSQGMLQNSSYLTYF